MNYDNGVEFISPAAMSRQDKNREIEECFLGNGYVFCSSDFEKGAEKDFYKGFLESWGEDGMFFANGEAVCLRDIRIFLDEIKLSWEKEDE